MKLSCLSLWRNRVLWQEPGFPVKLHHLHHHLSTLARPLAATSTHTCPGVVKSQDRTQNRSGLISHSNTGVHESIYILLIADLPPPMGLTTSDNWETSWRVGFWIGPRLTWSLPLMPFPQPMSPPHFCLPPPLR